MRDERQWIGRTVNKAIRSGILTPAKVCQHCGQASTRRRLDAHHWHGYDSAHILAALKGRETRRTKKMIT